MKPKVGLVGFFGWGNFGDELFIDAHREYLGEHFDLEVVNDMLEAPYLSERRLAELSKYDAFLIGGGDLINPSAVSQLYWRKEYLSKPVFVHGIGVPQPAKKMSKSILHYQEFFRNENVKFTCVRDPESLAYFREVIEPANTVTTHADPVCAMTLPDASRSKEKLLGVAIRHHRSVVGQYEQVRAGVDRAKQLGYRIRMIVLGNGNLGEADRMVSETFRRPDEELVYSDDLRVICRAIGECHQLMSMKFHGMVVATMYGVPSLQLSATQKNRNFLRRIQRPDMQSNYTAEDIPLRLALNPAPIHSAVVDQVRSDAKEGYAELLEQMSRVLL